MIAGSSMQAMTRTAPPQCTQVSMLRWKTRFRRWAQVMAAWRSQDVGTSVVLV